MTAANRDVFKIELDKRDVANKTDTAAAIATATTGQVTFVGAAFKGVTPASVTGICPAADTGLKSLLTVLATMGLIVDNTTAE